MLKKMNGCTNFFRKACSTLGVVDLFLCMVRANGCLPEAVLSLSPNAWMTTAALSGRATSPAVLWHLLFLLFLGFEGWFLAATATRKGFSCGFGFSDQGCWLVCGPAVCLYSLAHPPASLYGCHFSCKPVLCAWTKPFRLVLRVLHHYKQTGP